MFNNPLSQFWMDLDVGGLILKREFVGMFCKKKLYFQDPLLTLPFMLCG